MKMNRLLVRGACYYTNASTRGPSQKVKNWVSTKDRAAREAKRLFSRFVSSAARKVIIYRWIQEQFSREYNVACKENKLPKIQMSIFSLRVYKPRKDAWIFVRGQIRGLYLLRDANSFPGAWLEEIVTFGNKAFETWAFSNQVLYFQCNGLLQTHYSKHYSNSSRIEPFGCLFSPYHFSFGISSPDSIRKAR